MSGETVAVTSRPRAPPGGPLRSLLWWLRPPHRSSSEESVSSVGSDRTAVSFAFLPPANYRTSKPTVCVVPPPGPPTDSYRKRIRDRDLRRHLDREITLQRKYRLPSAADGTGYNAFSLPPARRTHSGLLDKQERARRATSEYAQRRVAHVPGKRRAPQPPTLSLRHPPSGATLPRQSSRKRRAPPPPSGRTIQRLLTIEEKVHTPDDKMDSKTKAAPEKRSIRQANRKMDEDRNDRSRNTKTKSEVLDHRFFKNCKFFDSKKRMSTADSPLIRVLPNISELDRQASEIYESSKLKGKNVNDVFKLSPMPRDGHPWICTKCLKKYASDVIVCKICYPEEKKSASKVVQENASSSSSDRKKVENINSDKQLNIKNKENRSSLFSENINSNKEDKEKLIEILKEMKHSLPKHPKPKKTQSSDSSDGSDKKEKALYSKSRESPCQARDMPTLRIGCSFQSQSKNNTNETTDDNQKVNETSKKLTQNPVITEITVLSHFSETKMDVQNNHKEPEKNDNLQNKKENTEIPLGKKNDASSGNLKTASITTVFTPGASSLVNSNDNGGGKSDKIVNVKTTENKDTNYNKYEHSGILKLLNLPNVSVDKIKVTDDQMNFPSKTNKSKEPIVTSHLIKSETITQQIPQIDNMEKLKTNISENSKRGSFIAPSLQAKDENASNSKETVTNASAPKTSLFSDVQNISDQIRPMESVSTTHISNNRDFEKDKQQATSASTSSFPNSESRRRDLVNQLERSIAQGDEHAAAEAAMGLAKMRIPCSVLSAPTILNTITPEISKPLTITGLINSITSNTASSVPYASTSSSKTNRAMSHLIKPAVPSTSMQTQNTSSEFQNRSFFSQNKPTGNGESNVATKPTVSINISDQPSTSTSSDIAISNLEQPNKVEANTSISTSNVFQPQLQTVDVIVEDRELQRGPVPVPVPSGANLGELRRRAELALGIPERLQRWIIGKTLCNDEEIQLVTIAGPELDAPFYLCLVESDTNRDENFTKNGETSSEVTSKSINDPKKDSEKEVYRELVELERCALVPTGDEMECGVCLERCARGAGAVLRECLHAFCRDCLAAAVRHCDEPIVACPAVDCGAQLQEREVKALVSAEDYEKWLARGLATAESGARHAFHCRTADCGGWALCEPGVRRFHCPVCDKVNCVPCQAIHEGETCQQHRNRALLANSTRNEQETTSRDVDEGTRALLDSLVARGEALECPDCSAIITKKWGCDWVRCSACKTEICWVTRGRRWGPGGRGDTSGGCRCGIDGRRCHPSCSYCH